MAIVVGVVLLAGVALSTSAVRWERKQVSVR